MVRDNIVKCNYLPQNMKIKKKFNNVIRNLFLYTFNLSTSNDLFSVYGGGGGGHRGEMVGGGPTSGSHGRRKRTWTRAVFSNLQRKGLEKRFQLQKYITKPDRRQLAATLGLTDAQVGARDNTLFCLY